MKLQNQKKVLIDEALTETLKDKILNYKHKYNEIKEQN
jgi:hypothetical protein